MSRFADPAMLHQKFATHTKAHDFEYKMDFEYKSDHYDVSSKNMLVYKQIIFFLKMIMGCHPG